MDVLAPVDALQTSKTPLRALDGALVVLRRRRPKWERNFRKLRFVSSAPTTL